jgi:hypothetical protein
MSSRIDNSGTGEASGKKSWLKRNKSGQILIHGSPDEQESTSVPHGNRQETVNLVVEYCRFMQNRRRLRISPQLTQKLEILSCLLVNLRRIR